MKAMAEEIQAIKENQTWTIEGFQLERNSLAANGFIVSSTSLMDQLRDIRLVLLFKEIIK